MRTALLPGLFLLLAQPALPQVSDTVSTPTRTVTFAWDYPTNELSPSLTFILYSAADLSLSATNWVSLTNTVGTNLTLTISITPGLRFFYLTASNFWGESLPSQMAVTPATAKTTTNLTIRRGL